MFLKQIFEVSFKIFCRKWEGGALLEWFFIIKQLKKCQSDYYPDNLRLISFCRPTSLYVLMFSISLLKTNLWSYWKWHSFEGIIWPLKKEIYFHYTYLFLIFVKKELEMELKIFFIIFEEFFDCKHSNSNV